jgi:porin
VFAQDEAQAEPPRELLLGDLWGKRSALEDRGISAESWLILETGKNFRGGLDTEGSSFLHYFSLELTFDLEKIANVKGAEFYLLFENEDGQSLSEEVGDYQLLSNIDMIDGRTQISEIWYRQQLFDGKVAVKLGKIDVNYDFGLSEYSLEFSNASIGYPLSSVFMPTFPDPSFGADLFVHPNENFYAGLGVFDGALAEGVSTGDEGPATLFGPPADLYLIAEAGLKWKLGGNKPGWLRGGAWYQVGTFDTFAGGTQDGATGGYLILDQQVWRANPEDEEDDRGIGVFLAWDMSEADVMFVDQHIGAGALWKGPIHGRDADVVGAGVSAARFTDEPGAGFVDEWETAIELFYKVQITPYLSIRPDVQYVFNPGGTGADDALAGLLRMELSF